MKLPSTAAVALLLAAGAAGGALAQGTTTSPAAPAPAATNAASAGASETQPAGQEQPSSAAGAAAGQTAPAPMRQGSNAQPPSNAPTTQPAAAVDPQVQQVQQQLRAAGLYNGPEDGLIDPDTRMGIARFQQQHGLKRTGTLDQATLARLLSNQTSGFGSSEPAASPAAPTPGDKGAAAPDSAGGSSGGSALVPPR
ncbi:MAG TPA: peptidoglycan-binding domain-containing protein [Stellaceae bacterium]|jgi:peptidoglycan hydrolase-like protein with peptidoglycan-binding domain|nr:peptidoglycan-binding domain-containing protein [Stellaceae bacterium]